MRFLAALSALAVLGVVASGCLHDDDGAATRTVTQTVTETAIESVPEEAPEVLRVYFLRDGKVHPLPREVVTGRAVAGAALMVLLEGVARNERGFETSIDPGVELETLRIDDGVATVHLTEQLADARARAQVVYTLTQFPTVKRVAIDDEPPVGRAAFEEQTPAILVESPLPGETVEPGFEATGTANTFEATFQYELTDGSGRVISKDFVTATSGSGTRGTFRFEVPYEVDRAQQGALTVFEISAASGSRTNDVRIPLRLE